MRFLKPGLILFFLTFCPSSSWPQPPKTVRVAVVREATSFKLAIKSSYQILALNTNEQLYQGRRFWRAQKVIPLESGIQIGQRVFKIYGLRIQPEKSPSIYINGRRFRGAVDIIRQPNKTLLAVNHVDIEDYIRGVLYHEVAPWWPIEALKAQAIAARTFALYQSRVNAHKDFDLVSTSLSQVYGGRTSERRRTDRAVRLTQNKVLTYKNRLFPTFYHATCAGYTEDAACLWKIDLPPLKGRECKFCQRSPHFKWQAKLSLQDIARALEKESLRVGDIQAINIMDRDISGRVTDVEIVSQGARTKINAHRLRIASGPNIIKSTNFTVQIKKGTFAFGRKKGQAIFRGFGWGHGVGMCQWGAFFMARKRFNAQQILGYYYPQAKIKDIAEITNARGEIATF